jgi:manganese efflux pump family protein
MPTEFNRRMLTLLIVACSVAADATAVAIAAALRGVTFRWGLALACSFGVAQALMAGIGWFGGALLGEVWVAWDHWIALVLLAGVGVKMIREALRKDENRAPVQNGLASLLVLSIATSIDALAVGVSLPALGVSATVSLFMIGAVTLLFSGTGAAFGRFLGERFGRTMEIAGGVALIAIGARIVWQHTM